MFSICCYLALNLDKINDHPERISKIKPFIEQWKILVKQIIDMLITYLKHLNLIIWVIIMIYTFKATHYYLQMSSRILEKLVLKHMN